MTLEKEKIHLQIMEEETYYFVCENCNGWWSVTDLPHTNWQDRFLFCTHCGVQMLSTVREIEVSNP